MDKKVTNVVLVGDKPLWKYQRSLEMLFRSKNFSKVIIKARGKNINKAIDLSESSKNKFCKDLNLTTAEINIGTENYEKDGKNLSVSCIEIILKKK